MVVVGRMVDIDVVTVVEGVVVVGRVVVVDAVVIVVGVVVVVVVLVVVVIRSVHLCPVQPVEIHCYNIYNNYKHISKRISKSIRLPRFESKSGW